MTSFENVDDLLAGVPADVVVSLRGIDLGAGSELLHAHQLPALLHDLAERARVQSITASSAIEGVVVADVARARRIIDGPAVTLHTRGEQQLAGYRKALDYVFAHDRRPLNIGLILHLHRLLWSETDVPGGHMKTGDNLVVDRTPDGTASIRFTPVPARETGFYMSELVDRFLAAAATGRHHPVLLTGLFVLDLLVIHPFDDGNGRVARVVSNALLADNGYRVGRWVSLEQLIADRSDDYYAALLASTDGWHDARADPWPWLTFFTAVVREAYAIFAGHITSTAGPTSSKQERVKVYVMERAPVVFTMGDVRAAVPGVSDQTIRLVLSALKTTGDVEPDGTGRSAVWRRLTSR